MDPLVAVAVVLAVMFVGVFRRVGLEVVVVSGVVLSSILFGRVGYILSDCLDTVTDGGTLSLMLLVYLVFFLTNFLSASGAMGRVVSSLENVISDQRTLIAAVPAVIGLMPVLSGAVISAPFVDQIGVKADLTKERKHIINYWFRHVSEYVNPIYPGVLLATGMLGLSFQTFFTANLPVMAFYVLSGAAFLLYGVRRRSVHGRLTVGDLTNIVFGVAPILAAVAVPVVFNVELYLSLLLAVFLAVVINWGARGTLLKLARESMKAELIVLVFLVMLFKTVLDRSGVATQISASLVGFGVPVWVLLISLPMLMGFLTGLTLGFVGTTFPLLMPFLTVSGVPNLHAITLAYVSGYVGLLFSPMHLCFSVTQKYFNADLGGSYRLLLPPLALTFAWTLFYVTFL